jgi:hypothetical protein
MCSLCIQSGSYTGLGRVGAAAAAAGKQAGKTRRLQKLHWCVSVLDNYQDTIMIDNGVTGSNLCRQSLSSYLRT